jgi:hypothetical protein
METASKTVKLAVYAEEKGTKREQKVAVPF